MKENTMKITNPVNRCRWDKSIVVRNVTRGPRMIDSMLPRILRMILTTCVYVCAPRSNDTGRYTDRTIIKIEPFTAEYCGNTAL